jgi:hypothetical protein
LIKKQAKQVGDFIGVFCFGWIFVELLRFTLCRKTRHLLHRSLGDSLADLTKLIRLSTAGFLADSSSMTQLPVAHVLCATLPPTASFAKFGSLLNLCRSLTAAGAGFFN